MDRKNVVVHRVNNLARANQAASLGIGLIECDIVPFRQIINTSDGELIEEPEFYVGHPSQWREAGVEVDQYDCFVGKGKEVFPALKKHLGELPTVLVQFLVVCRYIGLQVFVDLKWHRGWIPEKLSRGLCDMLRDGNHVMISYDHEALALLHARHPKMRLGIVTHDVALKEVWSIWLEKIDPRYIFFANYCEPTWGKAEIKGTRRGVHGVNDVASWERVCHIMGDDCLIITDNPEKLLK